MRVCVSVWMACNPLCNPYIIEVAAIEKPLSHIDGAKHRRVVGLACLVSEDGGAWRSDPLSDPFDKVRATDFVVGGPRHSGIDVRAAAGPDERSM